MKKSVNKKILLVVPVYNEELILEQSILKLHNYMSRNIRGDWTIVIANNASTDNTANIADNLAKRFKKVKVRNIKLKGRGNALKQVWSSYDADVYAYCDVDLATDISRLGNLFKEILDGASIAVGSRYSKDSKTRRTMRRYILSKGYIFLIRLFFKTTIKDFQCGFKAVDKRVVKEILPEVRDKKWFFDTELLLVGEARERYKIVEVPVNWNENPKSKVKFSKTILDYVINLINLKLRIKETLVGLDQE